MDIIESSRKGESSDENDYSDDEYDDYECDDSSYDRDVSYYSDLSTFRDGGLRCVNWWQLIFVVLLLAVMGVATFLVGRVRFKASSSSNDGVEQDIRSAPTDSNTSGYTLSSLDEADSSETPTPHPTLHLSPRPSWSPTSSPTENPTRSPTLRHTYLPTVSLTLYPTWSPITSPTFSPSRFLYPTNRPTTSEPTPLRSHDPTRTSSPTSPPTSFPTLRPGWHSLSDGIFDDPAHLTSSLSPDGNRLALLHPDVGVSVFQLDPIICVWSRLGQPLSNAVLAESLSLPTVTPLFPRFEDDDVNDANRPSLISVRLTLYSSWLLVDVAYEASRGNGSEEDNYGRVVLFRYVDGVWIRSGPVGAYETLPGGRTFGPSVEAATGSGDVSRHRLVVGAWGGSDVRVYDFTAGLDDRWLPVGNHILPPRDDNVGHGEIDGNGNGNGNGSGSGGGLGSILGSLFGGNNNNNSNSNIDNPENSPAPDIRWGASVAISEDGSTVVVAAPKAGEGGEVRAFVLEGSFWAQRGATITSGDPGSDMGLVALSADGRRLAVGTPNVGREVPGSVRIHEYDDDDGILGAWRVVGTRYGFGNFGQRLTLSGDGHVLAVAVPLVGRLCTYELVRTALSSSSYRWRDEGECLNRGNGSTRYTIEDDLLRWSVSLSHDGRRLAVGSPDRGVEVYEFGQVTTSG